MVEGSIEGIARRGSGRRGSGQRGSGRGDQNKEIRTCFTTKINEFLRSWKGNPPYPGESLLTTMSKTYKAKGQFLLFGIGFLVVLLHLKILFQNQGKN
jgi:hypothetical protein